MTVQIQFDFNAPRFLADSADPRIAELIEYLNGRGWVSARDIPQWDDRTVRLLASSSQGQIISGQKGYKLTCQATPEEFQRATSWLESQAKQMAERARAIRRAWHKG